MPAAVRDRSRRPCAGFVVSGTPCRNAGLGWRPSSADHGPNPRHDRRSGADRLDLPRPLPNPGAPTTAQCQADGQQPCGQDHWDPTLDRDPIPAQPSQGEDHDDGPEGRLQPPRPLQSRGAWRWTSSPPRRLARSPPGCWRWPGRHRRSRPSAPGARRSSAAPLPHPASRRPAGSGSRPRRAATTTPSPSRRGRRHSRWPGPGRRARATRRSTVAASARPRAAPLAATARATGKLTSPDGIGLPGLWPASEGAS